LNFFTTERWRSHSDAAATSRSLERPKALVVDADDASRAFAAEALNSFAPGFDVATAREPQQALAWIDTFPPDLLLTDLQFSGDGAGTLRERLRADARTRACRVVVLSSPHNPSGVLASEEDLLAIAWLAGRRGITVLVDEVYLDLAAAGHPPAATLSPAFVSTNSLTKAYGLASLRCGWALASSEVTEKIRRARDVVDVWSPMPADRLSVVAFGEIPRLAWRARRIVEANAPLVSSFLAGREELECSPSQATIAFPRFADGRDSGPFAERLFRDHGVAVVPGSFFDSPSHFRISFGGATAPLEEGLEAIATVLG